MNGHADAMPLSETLARLYLREPDIRRVAEKAGLDQTKFSCDPRPVNTWLSVLDLAQREGKIDALVDAALGENPADAGLRQVVEAYRKSAAITGAGPGTLPVLFDEWHGQDRWWRIPTPTVAGGYCEIAKMVAPAPGTMPPRNLKPIDGESLSRQKALVLPVGPGDSPRLSEDEMRAIRAFVKRGGGLLVLHTYAGDVHHKANLNELLEEFGLFCYADVVMPTHVTDDDILRETHTCRAPISQYVTAAVPATDRCGTAGDEIRKALLAGVASVLLWSPCAVYADSYKAVSILQSGDDCQVCEPDPIGVRSFILSYPRKCRLTATVLAASTMAKVVVAGSWKMFLDSFIQYEQCDNRRLFQNILSWLLAG